MPKNEVLVELFDNINIIGRLLAKRLACGFGSELMTKSQLGVLFFLTQDRQLTIKDLATRFGISASAATQLADGLLAHGLITRTENQNDRRQKILSLSTAGRKKISQVKNEHLKFFSDRLSILTEEELCQLDRIQKKIIASLQ